MINLYGKPLDILCAAGFSVYLHSYSAIDSWLGRDAETSVQILTSADTAELARLFEELRYPGAYLADAALDFSERQTLYFHCLDMAPVYITEYMPVNFPADLYAEKSQRNNRFSFNLLEFYQDYKSRTFYDTAGIYPVLSGIRQLADSSSTAIIDPLEIFRKSINPGYDRVRAIMDAALILSKYFSPDSFGGGDCIPKKYLEKIIEMFNELHKDSPPGKEEQRFFLTGLVTSPNPGLGLEFLKACGFINDFWPELATLNEADHSKEYHPEGNAWKHTLETFRYRNPRLAKKMRPLGTNQQQGNICSLRLSLGLLLHDTGKPIAVSAGSRRYDGHAELGEIQAKKFLERLGFHKPLINDVCFLVRHHMLPTALPRLPFFRTEEIMSSPLFPILLELYRCDESSSFKGLDGYYKSSAAYQSFLRNQRNPYRSADGRKLNRNRMNEAHTYS
jgi:poly(A) polymerase